MNPSLARMAYAVPRPPPIFRGSCAKARNGGFAAKTREEVMGAESEALLGRV
jgi:hypothetical protein